jgi:putative membrane protein insertion efficiency factor
MFVVKLIRIYQMLFANKTPCCRYIPTCSTYAIEAIQKYGICHGGYMAFKRILRCHPFCGPHKNCGYDPVHTLKTKKQVNKK